MPKKRGRPRIRPEQKPVSIQLLLPKEMRKRLIRAAKKKAISTLGLIRLVLNEWLSQEAAKERLDREARKPK